MANIKKILNQTSWTGQELGQLGLTNFAVSYKSRTEGKSDIPYAIDPLELQKMVNSISDEKNDALYSGYSSIHEWLSIKVNIANAQIQSAQFRFKSLLFYIQQFIQAEEMYHYWEILPALMTKKEYDFFMAEQYNVNDKSKTLSKHKRALWNGIALLHSNDISDKHLEISEQGFYIEPSIQSYFKSYSLEAFFSENKDSSDNINNVNADRDELIRNYYYLKGYNLQIDMIASFYDVPELEAFKLDVPFIEKKIEGGNELLLALFNKIEDTHYKDKELQARKLITLKKIFPLLDYKSIDIPEKNIKAAQKLLKKFKAFSGSERYLFDSLMCIQPTTNRKNKARA